MDNIGVRVQANSEQSIECIISNHKESLDKFLLDCASEGDIGFAKALIAFILANHFAIRSQIEE